MPSRIEIALILFAPLVAALLTASCVLRRLFRPSIDRHLADSHVRLTRRGRSFLETIGSKK